MTQYIWSDPDTGGDWEDPNNWKTTSQPAPTGPPGAGDDVVINLDVEATITTDGATVGSLVDQDHTPLIGDLNVTGELTQAVVSGGAVTAGQFDFSTFEGTTLSAGSISGGSTLSTGKVTADEIIWADVRGATVSASAIDVDNNDLVVVSGGTLSAQQLLLDGTFATLAVSGGTATIGSAAEIDGPAGAPALIDVTGGHLDLRGGLTLDGGARLNDGFPFAAASGGVVSAKQLTVGDASSGAVFVGGANAHLNVTSDVIVGDSGSGSLIVTSGGHLMVSGDLESGVSHGGTASGAVSEATTDFDVVGDWRIGVAGSASWTLSSGVIASVGGITELGVSAGGSGALTVTGGGTTLITSGGAILGGAGSGTLIVQSSAALDVSAAAFKLGEAQKSKGKIQIKSHGTLTGDNTTVGGAGSGSISINGGAGTLSGTVALGESKGGVGGVSVSHGHLSVSGAVSVGVAGKGTVTAGATGVITAASTIALGKDAGGNGALSVSGKGAAVKSFGLLVGEGGVGTLKIANHGKVTTTGAAVVAESATTDRVTVTSAGNWTVSGALALGEGGTGSATISDGGVVQVDGDLSMGVGSGASGVIRLSGGLKAGSATTPSRLKWGGVLDVGEAGSGDLTITGGAPAASLSGKQGLLEIASGAGSTGSVTVTGAGSKLTGRKVTVGGGPSAAGGAGTLIVGSGGAAHFAQGAVIWGGDKIGVQGWLTLGGAIDDGLLNVTDGAATVTGRFVGSGTVAIGAGGTFTLDASKTKSANHVRIDSSAGVFSLTGGSAADVFQLSAAALKSQDTLIGGAGHDTLQFTTAGTIGAAAFTHVSGIDQIDLANGTNALTLGPALMQGADADTLTIHGGSGNDTINATQLAAGGKLVFDGGGGHDTIHAGQDDNIFRVDKQAGTLTIANAYAGGKGAHGALRFGTGLTDQSLWLEKSGANLVIDVIGTAQTVTLTGWFGTNRSARVKEVQAGGLEIDAGVSKLVGAMAAYVAAHPGFDPTASGATMPADTTLQTAITANWHH